MVPAPFIHYLNLFAGGSLRNSLPLLCYKVGYFGVMVPPVSVKQCHFERSFNYTKKMCYASFKIPFLKLSPFRSNLCEEFTILSNMASAMVLSPIISYQADTGIWEDIMVEALL